MKSNHNLMTITGAQKQSQQLPQTIACLETDILDIHLMNSLCNSIFIPIAGE